MKYKLLVFSLISSSAMANQINVDLHNLSNISSAGNVGLELRSKFNGYSIKQDSEHRFVDTVSLDGLDWAFWYGSNKFVTSNTNLISDVNTFGTFEYKNETPVHGNQYIWLDGTSGDYSDHSNHAISANKGAGFTFTVTPNKIGTFELDLYTHNWLSSSDFTACLSERCETIKNDISFEVTATKNSVKFSTTTKSDVITISYTVAPRQWDWSKESGYHSLEAINLNEVK